MKVRVQAARFTVTITVTDEEATSFLRELQSLEEILYSEERRYHVHAPNSWFPYLGALVSALKNAGSLLSGETHVELK